MTTQLYDATDFLNALEILNNNNEEVTSEKLKELCEQLQSEREDSYLVSETEEATKSTQVELHEVFAETEKAVKVCISFVKRIKAHGKMIVAKNNVVTWIPKSTIINANLLTNGLGSTYVSILTTKSYSDSFILVKDWFLVNLMKK